MSTILKYICGCQIYSTGDVTEFLHACDDHKVQIFNDAIHDFVKKGKIKHE